MTKWTESKPNFLNIHWPSASWLQVFLFFFSYDYLIKLMKEYSILNAQQKGCVTLTVTYEELRICIAILLTIGYSKLPRWRLKWDPSAAGQNETISSLIGINRFEQILQYLYCSDNNNYNQNDKTSNFCPFLK